MASTGEGGLWLLQSHDAFKRWNLLFPIEHCSYWQIPQLCSESGLFRVGLPREFLVRTFFYFFWSSATGISDDLSE